MVQASTAFSPVDVEKADSNVSGGQAPNRSTVGLLSDKGFDLTLISRLAIVLIDSSTFPIPPQLTATYPTTVDVALGVGPR